MNRSLTVRAVLAAALAMGLLLTAVAPAGADSRAPLALGPNQGQITGTIDAVTGDHGFDLVFVPILGSGDAMTAGVITSGADSFPPFVLKTGSYHVLVRSQSGASPAGWFPGNKGTELAVSGSVVVQAGLTTTVSWVLSTDPGTFTGSMAPGTGTYSIAAYGVGETPDRHPMAQTQAAAGAAWSLHGLQAGLYSIVVQPIGSYPQTKYSGQNYFVVSAGASSPTGSWSTASLPDSKPTTIRLAGADRYSTSVVVAQSRYSHPTSVFIVSGENYPDALGAGPAAALLEGPVLLVKPGSIPASVKTYLNSAMPPHIHIIGGPGAVSVAVENQLAAYSDDVTRTFGADRYATSRAVAQAFFPDPLTIYIANGKNFPDALGAGPAAALNPGPVLLVNGTSGSLDSGTAAIISAQDADFHVQIAGGTGGVSAGIEDDIVSLTSDVRRRAGSDRYATSAVISDRSFTPSNRVFLATGANFPDALSGGAIAASIGAPILLVRKDCIPPDVYAELKRLKPNQVYILGGTGVISDKVASLTASAECAS